MPRRAGGYPPGGPALDASELIKAAREARQSAYAPYSGFTVGAALLDTSGTVHRAANVENASYGLSICAERVAVTAAVSKGIRRFLAIAIAGPDDEAACMPCGGCRQVLHEFAPDLLVVVAGEKGDPRVIPLASLLPEPFGPNTLTAGEGE
jgi:cytidine deaminase